MKKHRKNRFFNKRTERIAVITAAFLVFLLVIAVLIVYQPFKPVPPVPEDTESAASGITVPETQPTETPVPVTPAPADVVTTENVKVDAGWQYADYSAISSGTAVLYHARPLLAKGITVCVNAGHGTSGGAQVKTLCHPDGTPKVTGGTTAEGETMAVAVSTGTELNDGTSEAAANLSLAKILKDRLLAEGYDVLMIREGEDVQLDNISRTLLANHYADCHIAIHYDSTDFDKGIFFMSVPSNDSYRSMEPVASHWQEHNAFGRSVVKAIERLGMKLFEGGEMEMDLTQTSYSSVPSIDLEVGDCASDHSEAVQTRISEGITQGINSYFEMGKSA